MSKLEELLAELCPDGVEYKSIREIAEVGTGNSNGNESVDNGLFSFFVRSQTIKSKDDYEYDEEAIIIPGEGGIGEIFHYINGKYALHQRVYRIHFIVEDVNTKFAYYYMQAYFKPFILKKAVSATVTSIRKPMIEDFPLPLPPLPVQREIVRILDNFTELTAELTTELTARRKQYEYYRDSLLEQTVATNKVLLNSVCDVYDGTHQTPVYTEAGVPFISVEDIDNIYATKKYISQEAFAKFRIKPQIGDVFMTRITAGIIGKCAVVVKDDDLAYYVSLALLRPNHTVLNSKYLKHYLESGVGRSELAKRILWNATPTKINKDDIGKIFILLPPLDVQERIVSILDRFDALCNDLTSGLPAEIEARKKQYEYYRDKLLTFQEVKA